MKKNTGITLVALVITIIILLILAGVAISMITGGEGLFAKANDAATKYNQAAKNEADLINQLLNGNYLNSGGNGQGGEEEQSYVGYYADLDPNDGKIDGIIFADLAVGGSGQWGDANGAYIIPVKTGLKEYYVSKKDYNGIFGTKDVLSPKAGNTGIQRFYVMALSDFHSSLTWYPSCVEFGAVPDTSRNFESGATNSATVISSWNEEMYGSQYKDDLWGLVQDLVDNGWFVPSIDELCAFLAEMKVTSLNYQDYGFSDHYWTSSAVNNETVFACSLSQDWVFHGPQLYIDTHGDWQASQKAVRLCRTM